mgnify:CR=1 FL=1
MKKVIIILSAVILFTACKKTDINGSTYYYIGPNQTNNTNSCPIDTAQLVFHPKDTLYTSNPSSANLQNFSVSFWLKTTQKDSGTSFPNFTFIIDRDAWGPAYDWSIGMINGGYLAAHGGKYEGDMLITKNQYFLKIFFRIKDCREQFFHICLKEYQLNIHLYNQRLQLLIFYYSLLFYKLNNI